MSDKSLDSAFRQTVARRIQWLGERASVEGEQFGDYRLLRELGRGGMGIVYKAQHRQSGRNVALKLILNELFLEEALIRFHREGEAIARLVHPNIIKVHELGCCEGIPYLALEFAGGGNLTTRLLATVTSLQAASLVHQLAEAVGHAHDRGIVHRDLKPSNVLVSADGTLKITDFGLVKELPDAAHHDCTITIPSWPSFLLSAQLRASEEKMPPLRSNLELSVSGALFGTPAYMAPEQAAGEPGRTSPATDVYALGVMLYEILTRRRPSRSLYEIVAVNPRPPSTESSGVPAELDRVCMRCLEKDQDKRYRNANELASDLKAISGGCLVDIRDCFSADSNASAGFFYQDKQRHAATTQDYLDRSTPKKDPRPQAAGWVPGAALYRFSLGAGVGAIIGCAIAAVACATATQEPDTLTFWQAALMLGSMSAVFVGLACALVPVDRR